MCCDPVGSDLPEVGECSACGGPVDADGDSTECCAWSPLICGVCGYAPCDDSC